MTNEEKNRLMDNKWPEEYPHGNKALLKAIKEASIENNVHPLHNKSGRLNR